MQINYPENQLQKTETQAEQYYLEWKDLDSEPLRDLNNEQIISCPEVHISNYALTNKWLR